MRFLWGGVRGRAAWAHTTHTTSQQHLTSGWSSQASSVMHSGECGGRAAAHGQTSDAADSTRFAFRTVGKRRTDPGTSYNVNLQHLPLCGTYPSNEAPHAGTLAIHSFLKSSLREDARRTS